MVKQQCRRCHITAAELKVNRVRPQIELTKLVLEQQYTMGLERGITFPLDGTVVCICFLITIGPMVSYNFQL